MSKYLFYVAVFLTIALTAGARELQDGQVATATSVTPFELRGASVSTDKGVPSWPVMPGDVVVAGDSGVTLSFQDGSKIVLGVMSEAKVSIMGGTPVFDLESGFAQYSLKAPSSVVLMVYGKTVPPKKSSGDLGTSLGNQASAVRHPLLNKSTILIVGAQGAAAAVGYTAYKEVSGGSSVSPSK